MSYLQEDYKGLIIKVEHDDINESPNEYGNTDLFLVANHRQFYVNREGFNPEDINMSKVAKKYMVFPLIAYIHSGVALSRSRDGYPFNDCWDSCQVGFIFVRKSLYNESEYGSAADSLLEEWNDYLSGNVWGYIIESEEGEHIDSCWGYVGDPDKCMEEAKRIADYEVRAILKDKLSELTEDYSICDVLDAIAGLCSQRAETINLDVQLSWLEAEKQILNCIMQIKEEVGETA